MVRTRIILPYFGTFNHYFSLWLDSCGRNSGLDWLIITDATLECELPSNVTVIKSSLSELKKEFQKKLDIPIVLEKSYKLCDYKQFYGYLFSEYLSGYDYWGYCDCDLIFGDIEAFLPHEVQGQYDKIFRTGHFSLVKNDPAINELFFQYGTYRISLTSPVIYGYDESITGYHLGFAGELIDSGYRFLDQPEWIADVDYRHYPFREVSDSKRPCIYSYENGKIYRIDWDGQNIKRQEKIYVHLQKRKMQVQVDIDRNRYLIIPNCFHLYDESLLCDASFWHCITREDENYFNKQKELRQNRIRDLKRFLHEPRKLDSILYRIRGHRG